MMVYIAETMEVDKGLKQWRVIMMVHIAETMERQHMVDLCCLWMH